MQQTKLGEAIRSLRKQNNMTQAALAGRLGITDKAVSKWERGISAPDISLFPKLASVFGVTVDDLLKDCTDEGQPSKLLQIFRMSHDIRTPLNIILGCADMAVTYQNDEKRLRRYLDNIRIAGQYLLGVISNAEDGKGTEVTRNADDEGYAQSVINKADEGNYAEKGISSAGNGRYAENDNSRAECKGHVEISGLTQEELLNKLAEEEGSSDGPDDGFGLPDEAAFQDFDFTGKRILLVEDMAINREITQELLKKTGAEVEFAEDGHVCVEKIKEAPAGYFDLILMDIQMPNMDGIEATRQIRALADKEKAELPIIAMTANVYEKDRNAAFRAGMNDFTEKPIIKKALLTAIRQHLFT